MKTKWKLYALTALAFTGLAESAWADRDVKIVITTTAGGSFRIDTAKVKQYETNKRGVTLGAINEKINSRTPSIREIRKNECAEILRQKNLKPGEEGKWRLFDPGNKIVDPGVKDGLPKEVYKKVAIVDMGNGHSKFVFKYTRNWVCWLIRQGDITSFRQDGTADPAQAELFSGHADEDVAE